LPDIKTKETEYLNILIALGGRAAEKFVLKNDDMLSTGSYSDLTFATETANKMVKAYGHGSNSFIIKHSDNQIISFHSESLLLNAEEMSRKIIENAEKEVDSTMIEYKALLMKLIGHLSVNSQITESEIKKLTDDLNIKIKDKNNYYNIKERILEFKKENL
jgi:ATP-dependent Zn protease